MNAQRDKKFNPFRKPAILAVLVSVGIFFQITEYIQNRSLWFDEANVANSLRAHSFEEITTVAKTYGYPLGFITVEKLMTAIAGDNEFALRFFPLLCSIVSVVMFPRVLRRFADMNITILATFLFSLGFEFIYYASEVKPYATDVLFSILLLNMFISIAQKKLDRNGCLRYALIGCLAIIFSTKAILILLSAGVALWINSISGRKKAETRALFILNLCWGTAFILYFSFFLGDFVGSYNPADWREVYSPPPHPLTLDIVDWMFSGLWISLFFPLHYTTMLGSFLFVAGAAFGLGKERKFFLIVMAPALTTIILSFWGYPLYGRLILFLMPLVIIVLAWGINTVLTHPALPCKNAVGLFGLVALVFPALFLTANQFTTNLSHEDIKPVLECVRDNILADDVIYLSPGTLPAFDYYAPRYGLADVTRVVQETKIRGNIENCRETLQAVARHKRAWIVMSHQGISDDVLLVNATRKFGGNPRSVCKAVLNPRSAPFSNSSLAVLVSFDKLNASH